MAEIQKALLSAAGSVAGAGLAAKRIGRPQKSESPSAVAAKKAKDSLQEHREAKKRSGAFQTYESEKNIRKAPVKI